MKISGIMLPDVPDAGVIDGEEMILVVEENQLKAKQLSDALKRIWSITLFECGVSFVIFAGDGGSNGLSFTGTRGVFTLSAATPFSGVGSTILAGCYAYIPAGAGGLPAGLYWCVMSDDTNGEIFAETYTPGSGNPKYIASPTQLANCTPGRITQTTSAVTTASFVMTGGSLGPNGIMTSTKKWLTSSTAGTKTPKVTVGSATHFSAPHTNSFNNQIVSSSRQNMGRSNAQIGNRVGGTGGSWDCGQAATNYLGDVTSIDTTVDNTVAFTMQISANTDSMIFVPMLFTVQYGA